MVPFPPCKVEGVGRERLGPAHRLRAGLLSTLPALSSLLPPADAGILCLVKGRGLKPQTYKGAWRSRCSTGI